MSAPIGPGTWVECIQNRLPTTLPPRGLVVGRIYRVEDVGVTPAEDTSPGVPWVRLVAPQSDPRKWGFRAAWFRPVYAQDKTLIDSLKAPPKEAPIQLPETVGGSAGFGPRVAARLVPGET